jgi:DNA-binding transcriptional ArsR family regulator
MSEPGHQDGECFEFVPTDEVDRVPLRTAISPLPTAFTLTRDALQDGRRGTPAVYRRTILSTLRRQDTAVFAPMVSSSGWPGLLDGVHGPRETLAQALERLNETPGSALMDALDTDPDVRPTPAWDAVRRDPDLWLRRYVDALHRAWPGVEPLWQRSAALLEREVERIHAAVERGVPTSQLINELSPRTAVVDDALRLAPAEDAPRRLQVGEQGVTVIPIIAALQAGTLATPGDMLVAGAYPVRDVWRAFDGQTPPPASLEALLGPQRGKLLERLDHPRSAGELAATLGLAPSAITFHLRSLEAAGLVVRVRKGRNVIVYRTPRGTQLLALYGMP